MKNSYWLPLLLTGALACGADEKRITGSAPDDEDNEVSEGRGNVTGTDAGTKKDGGRGGKDPEEGTSTGIKPKPVDPNDFSCDKLELQARPNAPEILIVLDRSGSMVGLGDMRNQGKNRWIPSVSAVKTLTSSLTETVAFGLMLFPAPGAMGVTIPGIGMFGGPGGCTAGKVNVEVDLNSAAKIATVLDMSAPDVGATPTAATLIEAKDALDKSACGDCPVAPKYVLLVTDGQPTCGATGAAMTAPEDIMATTDAIDDLTERNIKTYVIGYDTASDPVSAEAMDLFAKHGGTEKHFPVEDEKSLVAELTRIAGELVPCEFDLSEDITRPELVRVEIDGTTYVYGTDWTYEGRKIKLDAAGGACPVLRDAKVHALNITVECEPVQVI